MRALSHRFVLGVTTSFYFCPGELVEQEQRSFGVETKEALRLIGCLMGIECFDTHVTQMNDMTSKRLPKCWQVGKGHAVLLAHFLDDGGNCRVVVLRDAREQVVYRLVVQSSREESHHFRNTSAVATKTTAHTFVAMSVIDRCFHLGDSPFVIEAATTRSQEGVLFESFATLL